MRGSLLASALLIMAACHPAPNLEVARLTEENTKLQAELAASKAREAAPQEKKSKTEIVVATGGSQQNVNDICWVLFKRPTSQVEGEALSIAKVNNKDEFLTLGCYRVIDNGRKMMLVGARNISWDLDMYEFMNERLSVMEVITLLREEERKRKRDDK